MQKKEESKKETLEEEERRKKEKKIERVEVKVKISEKVEEKVEKITYEEGHLIVPLIKLENIPELQLKKLEVNKGIPQIEKRKKVVPTPIIEIQELSPILRECKLDYKIPSIEKRKRSLTIPIIRVNPPPKISVLLMEFDTEISKPKEITLPKIKVPIYRKATLIPPKFLIETFDSTINEQLMMRLEKREEMKKEVLVKGVEEFIKIMVEEASKISEGEESKLPSLEELIFEEKSGKGPSKALTYSGETVYVVLEKLRNELYECKDTFHYLCIRSLREYIAGAETRAISGIYGKGEIEKYLGEREITIVDTAKLLKEGVFKRNQQGELILGVEREALADRMRSFAEGYKFVIFYVAPEEAKILYEKLWELRSKFHDKIFWVSPNQQLIRELDTLAMLLWAFVEIPETNSFDSAFGSGKTEYYKRLEEIREIVESKLEKPYPVVKTHRSNHESREHYLLKCFLAKYLVDNPPEELQLLQSTKREERYKKIKFEHISQNISSDVYIEDDNVAIEVETLFEEGIHGGDPVAKIRDVTVEKYIEKDSINVRKLWIVMENLTMARHLKELLVLKDLYERRYKGKVEFFALDLKNERLMPIEEFTRRLHEIKRELESINQ